MLDNNNKQIISQLNNNKDTTINNIQIIANNSRQKYILTKLKITSFNSIINININYSSILINCVL